MQDPSKQLQISEGAKLIDKNDTIVQDGGVLKQVGSQSTIW